MEPVVTPIILNLINLGLEAIAKEDFNLESLTDKVSATNQIDFKTIEEKVTANLADKLSGINQIDFKTIEEKVTANLADKLSGINQIDVSDLEKKIIASLEDKLESMVETKVNELLNEISLTSSLPQEDEKIEAELEIIEDNKSNIETGEDNQLKLIEDTKNNLSLNQTELGKRLGYKSHSQVSTNFKKMSKERFIEWSKSKDPQNKGWYKIGDKFSVID